MGPIYRKSSKGQTELTLRSGALDSRTRALLILVNGRDPVSVLQQRIGTDIAVLIAQLHDGGYVELVNSSADQASPAPLAQKTGPADTPADARPLENLKRAAIARLTSHFGPDVQVVGQALLAAKDHAAYVAALAAIERKLAIYVGKKQAARIVAELRS